MSTTPQSSRRHTLGRQRHPRTHLSGIHRPRNNVVTGLAAFLLWALALLSPAASAHPWHTSFAEVDWNEAGDALEVSLRVLPEDLETALTWRAGRTVVLEDTETVRSLIQDYLADHFLLRDGRQSPSRPQLAGLEIAYDNTWLYFTLPARPDTDLSLRNTILMDVDSTQTNRVHALWEAPDETRIFTYAVPEQSLWHGR